MLEAASQCPGRRPKGPAPRGIFGGSAPWRGAHSWLAMRLRWELIALLLALSPTVANGAPGLYLTWNDCALGPTASSNETFACDANTDQSALYCAFTMPQARDSVLGVEVVVDVQHTAAAMPDWWRFESGGCRAGALNQSGADFTGQMGCVDPWQGAAFGGIQSYNIGPPIHAGANQARIRAVAAVVSSLAASLNATSMYYGFRIVITREKTQAPGPCFGCLGAACLVFNSVLVRRLPGSSGDEFIQTPGPANANWATWQGAGANCAAVPVRRTTWGSLKSLYR